jgi:hypothetical protein
VRLALVNFGEKHLSETELVNKKLDRLDREISSGKRKLLTPKEALGKYAKHLK